MIKILILLSLLVNITVKAGTYYVATTGNDNNPGTIDSPWATWQKGFDEAIAGDTIYFRAGVWSPTSEPILNPSASHGTNGTYANPICFFNYPGETPILDCSEYTSEVSKVALDVKNATYVNFRGLTVRNCYQIVLGQWISGISFYQCGVIKLDRMVCHDIQGYGIWIIDFDTLTITNCDSYNNQSSNDPEPGNRADGFTFGSGTGEPDPNNLLICYGNRSWNNSDDGFEVSPACQSSVHNNWAFSNGHLEYGAGTAFKYVHGYLQSLSTRKCYNNIAAYNAGDGFVEQNLNYPYGPIMHYYNNIVYRGRIGFGSDPGSVFDCALHDADVLYQNNLVYNTNWSVYYEQAYLSACYYEYPVYAAGNHNTWIFKEESPYWEYNDTITVTDDDFVSMPDSADAVAQLMAPRKSDGSLPDITFLHLATGSDLIGAGTNVGMSATPDIGVDWAYLAASDTAPIVTNIPNQTITTGSSFATINLDNYVSDANNTDSQITWTYSGDTHINVSITNRVATITYDNGFTGSETITFTATDPDDLSDSDQAVFVVNAASTPSGTCLLRINYAGSKRIRQGSERKIKCY